MKYYVVADVHGFYDQMIKALTDKGYFSDEVPHKLIICGDLFDRGAQSKEMQQLVVDLIEKDEVILIRGNHEDLMLDLLNRIDEYIDREIEYTHHYSNRTVKTVMDLAECSLGRMKQHPHEIVSRMKATPFIKQIIPKMLDYFETANYIFVHGWIPCIASGYGRTADCFKYQENWREAPQMDWIAARWYNGMMAAKQGCIEPNKTIVCGHWSCAWGHTYLEGKPILEAFKDDFTPYYGEGVIAIDTCTALSQKVNCIVIEDDEINVS